jgi:hypothetical protein
MCPIFSGCEDTAVWILKSPDLTALDFCLWGWMKSEVYKEKVNTRDELLARIMNSAALIKQERQDASKHIETRYIKYC